jgi:hypothetical protein
MNKKSFLYAAVAWAVSFGLIYYFRFVIAIAALDAQPIQDSAFAWLPQIERAVVLTALLFSFVLYCFGVFAYWLANRRKNPAIG